MLGMLKTPKGRSQDELRVQSEGVTDVMLLGDGESRVENELLAACGEMAWARSAGDRVLSVGLVRGHSVECADGFSLRAPAGLRHCAVELGHGEIQITIEGAQCFHLTLPQAVSRLKINGDFCALDERWRRVAFVRDKVRWRLSEIDC
jgi:hypothetical protein